MHNHAEHTKMQRIWNTLIDASRMMSAILGENWSRGSGFMLQFMGAVCIVCMLSLFSNTHGLTWIATDHSPIDPRYPGVSWGIAQSQVIHHQTGPKYDPAGDNYAGTRTMWENHFSMQHFRIQQKMGRFIFYLQKKGLDHSQKTKKQKRQAQWTIHERLPSSWLF